MTEPVKRFFETNKSLLDKDLIEFFHSAYNELHVVQQEEVVHVLMQAGVDINNAREATLRFIVSMQIEVLECSIRVSTFCKRVLFGALGYTTEELFNFVVDNSTEWDVSLVMKHGELWMFPQEDFQL